MKVYAHYLKNEFSQDAGDLALGASSSVDGNRYRWRTILQFGKSWNIIGSVFMKNPGSASPMRRVSESEKCFDELQLIDDSDMWYEFSADDTMRKIEYLFYVYTFNHGKKLDGVVQIFNLMNIMDPDLTKALEKVRTATDNHCFTTQEDMDNLVAPVYIGWKDLVFDFSKDIFQSVLKLEPCYLSRVWNENLFYHPQYLVGKGINKELSQRILRDFCNDSFNSSVPVDIPSINIDKMIVETEVLKCLDEYPKLMKHDERCRFSFIGTDIQITVTHCEKGYVGVRDLGGLSADKKSRIEDILGEHGYGLNPKSWLARKNFKEFGYDSDSVIRNIVEEMLNLCNIFSVLN